MSSMPHEDIPSLASKVMRGHEADAAETKRLAASVLRNSIKTTPRHDTGSQFLAMLSDTISPASIISKAGTSAGISLHLSDGRSVKVHRARLRNASEAEVAAYVNELVG